MVLVAASFVSAIYYFEASGGRVSAEIRDMLAGGVPAVEQLTHVRGALRHLDGALDRCIAAAMQRQPADEADIARARSDLATRIGQFRKLPFYHGEQALSVRL